jgi:hypothetical protein
VLDATPFKIFDWLATLNFMRCFITLQLRFKYLILYWIEKQNHNNNGMTLVKKKIIPEAHMSLSHSPGYMRGLSIGYGV